VQRFPRHRWAHDKLPQTIRISHVRYSSDTRSTPQNPEGLERYWLTIHVHRCSFSLRTALEEIFEGIEEFAAKVTGHR
jgi:hypothetical protein